MTREAGGGVAPSPREGNGPAPAGPFDLLCVGEALVDFLPRERGPMRAVRNFAVTSGGAPANVAIGASRLGARVAFAGVVGADEFGHFLRDALEGEGIDCAALRHSSERKTGLSFIALDEDGERHFDFYGAPSADMMLEPADADAAPRARIVHGGSNTLLLPAGIEATRLFLARGKAAGAVISLDPNLRLHRWREPAALQRLLAEMCPEADVVKLAGEEAAFVTGVADPLAAAQALVERGTKLAIVTRGAAGAVWARASEHGEVAAPQVRVVDATGAGDGFMAGLLVRLAEELRAGVRPEAIPAERLREHLAFGCRVGAAVVGHLGAVAGLPRAGEIT
jgi:fructokinase